MTLLKIALLVTDIPAEDIIKEDGDLPKLFKNLFEKATKSYTGTKAPVTIDIQPFMAINEELPTNPSDFDAMMMTGSSTHKDFTFSRTHVLSIEFSAYGNEDWIVKLRAYVKATYDNHPKVKWVGICFGHQILAEALGGKVEKNPLGWEVGWCELEVLKSGVPSLLSGPPVDSSKFCIQQMHQDHVTRLPPGFINLARTAVSENQVMMKPGHVLSIQSHPEFTASVVTKLVKARNQKKIFTDEQSSKWLQVVERPIHGEWFAHKVIEFLVTSQ